VQVAPHGQQISKSFAILAEQRSAKVKEQLLEAKPESNESLEGMTPQKPTSEHPVGLSIQEDDYAQLCRWDNYLEVRGRLDSAPSSNKLHIHDPPLLELSNNTLTLAPSRPAMKVREFARNVSYNR
jgi:hypothetical protein